ncbi:MAG: acyl-CoA dehydrogenase family protein, partial [Actinomycetes bacterium]
GFERGSSATTGFRRFLREWDQLVAAAQANGKNTDAIIRQDLIKSWADIKIMQINGYRSLTDSLNDTHHTAKLGACNKMFWSETHKKTMNLAIDILGMEGQILSGSGDAEGLLPGNRRGRDDYPVSTLQASFFFSRSETIWGGSAEIQRNIVGERALGLPKEPKVQKV